MPNNPVQIVLNDEAFLRAPDPKRGGTDKDFFEGRDAAFMEHRDGLIRQLTRIENEVKASPYGPLCYLRVRMRTEAIAKSYRPNRAVFIADQFPCVGAGAPGELFFRAPLIHFNRLRTRIATAEDRGETRRSRGTGNAYHYVSRTRSEVGAIETIEIAPSDRKRGFAARNSGLRQRTALMGGILLANQATCAAAAGTTHRQNGGLRPQPASDGTESHVTFPVSVRASFARRSPRPERGTLPLIQGRSVPVQAVGARSFPFGAGETGGKQPGRSG